MGNCCPCLGGNDGDGTTGRTSGGKNAFQVEGHRLGTAGEAAFGSGSAPASMPIQRGDEVPEPAYDPNLDDEQRAKIRADRAAAAEARLKKQGGNPGKKKKKKATNDAPLRGPNSKPLMTWTAN
mmetsp:Transcript_19932/g.57757  ORF Transcript_19932/g.57757 Transcript_19932/m.57757 type:complete len:124 (-) Transcript_19932:622-993(-)